MGLELRQLMKRHFFGIVAGVLVVVEVCLCAFIIQKVAYTEIDWIAYMQEVQGYEDGERNYFHLKGDTGPLVYPAGFLYLFSILKKLTDEGENIWKGQVIFAGIYILVLITVLKLYRMGKRVPAMGLFLLIMSKRIHSIFILRMFNDCVAVFLGYIAIYCFTKNKWYIGCLFYSGAVSVKMNMLLYAPGLLFCMLVGLGYFHTLVCLSICAGLQLILGFPFLTTYPYEYIKRSFDLGRVFMFKWTVNFKFLPEDVFVSKELSLSLLAATLLVFVIFAFKWSKECRSQMKVVAKVSDEQGSHLIALRPNLSPNFILVTLFTSNFIGIVFARSLHYQFYCWYFHTLPYLAWHTSQRILPVWLKLIILLGIEVAFNVFPASPLSSLMLQACHIALLTGLYFTPVPDFVICEKIQSNSKRE